MLFFLALFKTIGNFDLPNAQTRFTFPSNKTTEENQSSFDAPNDVTHKKKTTSL